jgi:hypothetical protein
MKQKVRDQGAEADDLDPNVAAHDKERAEETVAELERLGVLALDSISFRERDQSLHRDARA